jgi:hypothetical protein
MPARRFRRGMGQGTKRMSEAETATRFSVAATDRSIGGKLADLQDMVCELRDLIVLEYSIVDTTTGDCGLGPYVARNLDTAKRATGEKLDAIEALLDETKAAQVVLEETRVAA